MSGTGSSSIGTPTTLFSISQQVMKSLRADFAKQKMRDDNLNEVIITVRDAMAVIDKKLTNRTDANSITHNTINSPKINEQNSDGVIAAIDNIKDYLSSMQQEAKIQRDGDEQKTKDWHERLLREMEKDFKLLKEAVVHAGIEGNSGGLIGAIASGLGAALGGIPIIKKLLGNKAKASEPTEEEKASEAKKTSEKAEEDAKAKERERAKTNEANEAEKNSERSSAANEAERETKAAATKEAEKLSTQEAAQQAKKLVNTEIETKPNEIPKTTTETPLEVQKTPESITTELAKPIETTPVEPLPKTIAPSEPIITETPKPIIKPPALTESITTETAKTNIEPLPKTIAPSESITTEAAKPLVTTTESAGSKAAPEASGGLLEMAGKAAGVLGRNALKIIRPLAEVAGGVAGGAAIQTIIPDNTIGAGEKTGNDGRAKGIAEAEKLRIAREGTPEEKATQAAKEKAEQEANSKSAPVVTAPPTSAIPNNDPNGEAGINPFLASPMAYRPNQRDRQKGRYGINPNLISAAYHPDSPNGNNNAIMDDKKFTIDKMLIEKVDTLMLNTDGIENTGSSGGIQQAAYMTGNGETAPTDSNSGGFSANPGGRRGAYGLHGGGGGGSNSMTSQNGGTPDTFDTTINPKARGLLDTIASGEARSYNSLFGDSASHPNQAADLSQFPQWSGRKVGNSMTHAAGRYQFEPGTWAEAQKALHLKDFSPESQDKAAWWLAQRDYARNNKGHKLADDINSNDPKVQAGIATALHSTWTSLPGGSETTYGSEQFLKRLHTNTERENSKAATQSQTSANSVSSGNDSNSSMQNDKPTKSEPAIPPMPTEDSPRDTPNYKPSNPSPPAANVMASNSSNENPGVNDIPMHITSSGLILVNSTMNA